MIRLVLRIVFTFIAKLNVGFISGPIRVNFYSRFTPNTHIGHNCHFNGMVVRGRGRVVIGNNFHSGKGILLINSYHQYENANAIPYDTEKMVNKEIVIGDNAWLGDKVIVLGGVHIGEGAIIQAGAVVVMDIPKYAIAGGNPAVVFKYRSVESYNKLLKDGEFC